MRDSVLPFNPDYASLHPAQRFIRERFPFSNVPEFAPATVRPARNFSAAFGIERADTRNIGADTGRTVVGSDAAIRRTKREDGVLSRDLPASLLERLRSHANT
jgi:hypothetical protein